MSISPTPCPEKHCYSVPFRRHPPASLTSFWSVDSAACSSENPSIQRQILCYGNYDQGPHNADQKRRVNQAGNNVDGAGRRYIQNMHCHKTPGVPPNAFTSSKRVGSIQEE